MGQTSSGERKPLEEMEEVKAEISVYATSILEKVDQMVDLMDMKASQEAELYVGIVEGILGRLKDNITR